MVVSRHLTAEPATRHQVVTGQGAPSSLRSFHYTCDRLAEPYPINRFGKVIDRPNLKGSYGILVICRHTVLRSALR
jgi:hypothetical protein